MAKPIVLAWQLVTRAPIERTWKELSDTDRFNKVAEAGFTFTRSADGEATTGKIKKLGLTVSWTEDPFSFRAPKWFRIERVFEGGPAERLIARADLTSLPNGGTQVDYRIDVIPRGFFSSAILGIDLDRSSRPKIELALKDLVKALDEDVVLERYGGAPPPLTAESEALLKRNARKVTPSPLLDRLLGFLRVAPEREQARMSAPALADAWREQLDDVVSLLIQATEAGILAVTLDLLCPACQVPRGRLVEGKDIAEVHCEACGIRYDATFPELLAVHFRPVAELRELNVKIECIGSPGQSPHIVAQDHVPPGGETNLDAELRGGMYRLRTLPALGAPALLEVTDGGGARDAEFRCTPMIHPQLVRLASPRKLLFRNQTDRPLTVILERVERVRQLITAGRLIAEFPRFRSLAPVLPFFASLELYRAAVLSLTFAGESADAVAGKLKRAKLSYSVDSCMFVVYRTFGDLVDDAIELGLLDDGGALKTFGGASVGMVFEHPRAGRTIPMGNAVDEAYASMQGAGFGRLTAPARFADDPAIMRELAQRDVSADPHGYPSSDGTRLVELRR